jgi:hypothetical protein
MSSYRTPKIRKNADDYQDKGNKVPESFMQDHYVILTGYTPHLEETVNKYIREGYEPGSTFSAGVNTFGVSLTKKILEGGKTRKTKTRKTKTRKTKTRKTKTRKTKTRKTKQH